MSSRLAGMRTLPFRCWTKANEPPVAHIHSRMVLDAITWQPISTPSIPKEPHVTPYFLSRELL